VLENIDDVYNVHRTDSEAGKLNAALGRGALPRGVRVSADLAEALGLSFEAHRLTDGAFDITVKPLIDLWRGAAKAKVPPADAEVAKTLARSGMAKLRLEGDRLISSAPGVSLDFGGIVKGIAVDRVVAMLKSGGARSGLVQVGGETACWGLSSKRGKPHVVGVRHPLAPLDGRALWTAIADPGTGLSCATSGNYFSPIVIGGKPYYHIIDPRSGHPVDTRTLSVTIAFPSTGKNSLADALSTAGAVLGPEKAIALAQRLGAEALVIYIETEGTDPREAKTPGWDALVPK
jgi:thiamine biosynthesis lipoprotein